MYLHVRRCSGRSTAGDVSHKNDRQVVRQYNSRMSPCKQVESDTTGSRRIESNKNLQCTCKLKLKGKQWRRG